MAEYDDASRGNNVELFEVVRLLSLLGQSSYRFSDLPGSAKSDTRVLRDTVVAIVLLFPAAILVTLSQTDHNFSFLFSKMNELLAAVLSGAGATTAVDAVRARLQPQPVSILSISTEREVEILQSVLVLKQLVPDTVAERISHRVKKCWERYEALLVGDNLPDEIERGTNQLKSCICKEVLRVKDLNGGSLPDSADILNEYMYRYDCESRLRTSD